MTAAIFDTLGYAKKLEAAGFTREQAEVQANALREFTTLHEEQTRNELATKRDLRETELRLQKEIEKLRYDMLKWQFGVAAALAVIMAKGFGWIGF